MEIHSKLIVIYDTIDATPAGRLQFRNALISRLGLSDRAVVSLLAGLPAGIMLELSDEEGARCVKALEQLGAEVEIVDADSLRSSGMPLCEEPELMHALTFLGQSGLPTEVLRAPNATVETLEELLESAIHGSTEELAASLMALETAAAHEVEVTAAPAAPARPVRPVATMPERDEETLSLSALSLDDAGVESPRQNASALCLDSELSEEPAGPAPAYPTPPAPNGADPSLFALNGLDEEEPDMHPPAPQAKPVSAPPPMPAADAAPERAAAPADTSPSAPDAESSAEDDGPSAAIGALSDEQIQSAFARTRPEAADDDDSVVEPEAAPVPAARFSKRMQLCVAAGCTGMLLLALGFSSSSSRNVTFNLTDRTVEMLLDEQKRILGPKTAPAPPPRVVEATFSGLDYQAPVHSEMIIEQAEGRLDAAKLIVRTDEAPRRTPLEIARNTKPIVWIKEFVSEDLLIEPPVPAQGGTSFAVKGTGRAYLSDELVQGRAKVNVEIAFTYSEGTVRGEWRLYNIPDSEAGSTSVLERTGPSSYRISLRGTATATKADALAAVPRSIEELADEIAANYLPSPRSTMLEQTESADTNPAVPAADICRLG